MRYCIFLSFIMLIVACESDVEINVKEGRSVTNMYAFIYPDSAVDVQLSKSVNIFSPVTFDYVKNAIILLTVNSEQSQKVLMPNDTNYVRLPAPSLTYGDRIRLVATVNNADSVVAETFVPTFVPISGIDTTTVMIRQDGKISELLSFALSFADDRSTDDYYQVVVERQVLDENRKVLTSEKVDFNKDDNVFNVAGQSIIGSQLVDLEGVFDDMLFNGHNYNVNFSMGREVVLPAVGEQGVRLRIRLYHHTYDYYNYFCILKVYDYSDFFQAIGQASLYSNVTNGVGLISGMSFDEYFIYF